MSDVATNKVTLEHWARVDINGSLFEGGVSMISGRGICVDTDCGTKFVKWYNVKEVFYPKPELVKIKVNLQHYNDLIEKVRELEKFADDVDFVCDLFECDPTCDSYTHDANCLHADPILAWKKVLEIVEPANINAFLSSRIDKYRR